MIAVLAQGALQGVEDIAEEGDAHIRQQYADAAVALGFESSGERIGPKAEGLDGFGDGPRAVRR